MSGGVRSWEQQARDLLERLEHPRAQALTAGDVTELANILAAAARRRSVLQSVEYAGEAGACPSCGGRPHMDGCDLAAALRGADHASHEWQPIATCPHDGLFLVHEGGAMRVMYRSCGEWESTSVAVDQWGASVPSIKARETGVYNPTHWMPLPARPAEA